MTRVWYFVAADAHGEPTLWRQSTGDLIPSVVMQRSQFASGHRDETWAVMASRHVRRHQYQPSEADDMCEACGLLYRHARHTGATAVTATHRDGPSQHWFVADHSGLSCLACGLPRGNQRHARRRP